MSKIQEALRRLQKDSAEGQKSEAKPARRRQGFSTGSGDPSLVPLTKKKKVTFDGPRHHLEQADLVAGGLLAPLDHAVHVADEFRQIKRPLIRNAIRGQGLPEDHLNVIMIASALPKAGKTFCTVNLAVSMSLERELNVLLVDADVPKPHISREFGLADEPGLIDLLVDDNQRIEDTLIRTDLNDIQVLPAGRTHPQATELLASNKMSEIINELSLRYPDRIVLVDSPPLLITSEAQALATQVGQVVVVIEAGKTNHDMLDQTFESLDMSKAVNLVLNKSFNAGKDSYYGSDYGYYGYDNA